MVCGMPQVPIVQAHIHSGQVPPQSTITRGGRREHTSAAHERHKPKQLPVLTKRQALQYDDAEMTQTAI
jgi:hypothetical protein